MLSDSRSFTVVVNEVNSPPVLTVPENQTIDELSPWTVTNAATDPDIPANELTFSLISGRAGMSLDARTGVLSWTPTEAQGPSTNVVRVKVSDDGTPPLSVSQSFTVVVNEVNRAPTLAAIDDQFVLAGTDLMITNSATDLDVPNNNLTFSLDPGAPAGALINATSGVFTWRPTIEQAPSTNLVTVRVRDDGAPSFADAQSFNVIVASRPVIESIVAGANVTITWSAMAGKTYRVQFTSDLGKAAWSDLAGDITASGSTAMKTDVMNSNAQRYYRVVLLP